MTDSGRLFALACATLAIGTLLVVVPDEPRLTAEWLDLARWILGLVAGGTAAIKGTVGAVEVLRSRQAASRGPDA